MSEELVPMTIGWFDMPLEMREMVMEQMEVKTKGKLLQCSKECSDEVKGMKNFIDRIELCLSSRFVTMEVVFADGFKFKFIKSNELNDKIFLQFNSSRLKEFSEKMVGSFEEIALNRIKNWIYKAVNLDTLNVKLADFPLVDFDITHLKKLKYIKIESEMSFGEFLNEGLMGKDQFWSIENITLDNFKFTIEDLCGLKSSSIKLKNTNVSGEMLNQFLKSWISGKIDKNFTKMKVEMKENKNKTELSSIILREVNAIGQHVKYDCIWARLMNSNNEWAEIHISSNSFIMICKTSAEKFEYKAFDIFDEMNMVDLSDFSEIMGQMELIEDVEFDPEDYEGMYDFY